MNFTDIKTMTYSGNLVSIDGVDMHITTPLVNIDAVQFHKGRSYILEEPTMAQVPLEKYQYVLSEWIEAKKLSDNPVYTEEELKQQEIDKLKQYLSDTDFYMTVDKYETLTTERQEELKAKRAEARVVINDLEG